MFTQIERRYLMAEHSGMAVINQETMQIPPRILNAILARRAQMLGRAFVEFRNENRTDAASRTENPSAGTDTLSELEASKLF